MATFLEGWLATELESFAILLTSNREFHIWKDDGGFKLLVVIVVLFGRLKNCDRGTFLSVCSNVNLSGEFASSFVLQSHGFFTLQLRTFIRLALTPARGGGTSYIRGFCTLQLRTFVRLALTPTRGGSSYIRMIGMVVVLFRGCNRRFSIL